MGFRALFLAGERADPDTVKWAQKALNVPIIDNFWATETNGPIVCNPLGLHQFPIKPGSATLPTMGYDLRVLDDDGNEITERNKQGNLVIKLPLPPGCFHTLFNNHERWIKSYMTKFPGYFNLSDGGFIDDDGYVHVMGRTDDVINCAGHRLSSGQLEQYLTNNKYVAEAAVIGAKDPLKGQIPIGFIVLKTNVVKIDHSIIEKELINSIRQLVGPVAAFKKVFIVSRLPKTRSGKILRNVIRALIDGEEPKIPATIEDISVIKEIKQIIDDK